MVTALQRQSAFITAPDAADRPLRVLFYLFFPSRGSGVARYTHQLLQALTAEKGIDPELACAPSFGWRDEAAYGVAPVLRELYHSNRFRRRLRFLAGQFANPLRMLRYAQSISADIVHFSNVTQLTFPLWGRRLDRLNVPIVATVHDAFRSRGLVHPAYDNAQLTRFYRRADALFVHSDQQAALLESCGVPHDRIHLVVHGPYDYGSPTESRTALRQRYGLPPEKQVALFFGSVRDDKNLDLFLRAARSHQAKLHVLIAGRFNDRQRFGLQQCQGLVRDLGLSDSVTILPRHIPDEEVADLFTACDWVALPYGGQFSSQSGVLNVAAAYDRPVLVSGTGGMLQAIRACDIGVATVPDDVAALDVAMGELMARITGGCRFEYDRYRDLFSWQVCARSTMDVYRELAGRPSNPEEAPGR